MTAAELVDSLLSAPALVFGSLPPEGRDLDLVVRPAEVAALEDGLAHAGFLRRGREWARFAGPTVESLEVAPAVSFGLPAGELDALYEDALPVEGFRSLVRPAPHHVLLIAARRAVRDGRLDRKRRARVDAALAEDPAAWEVARRRASTWGARKALDALARAHATGAPIPVATRADAIREELATAGAAAARLRAWRSVTARPRTGPVVSFSGLDGSGKSSQAQALRDALLQLGFDVAVKWTRISYNPSLDVIAAPVKRVLRRGGGEGGDDEREAARELRERNPLVRQLWVSIVAAGIGRLQRRATRPHVRRGRAVVCDRYTLDSIVQLRHTYGERRRFGLQIALIRLLSPGPRVAFLLDVPPETALARKAEDYGAEELAAQARLYREVAEELGAIRLDGTRPRDELCAEIAQAVWERL